MISIEGVLISQSSSTLQDLCLKALEQPLQQLVAKMHQIETGDVIFPWKCTSLFLNSVLLQLIDSHTLLISKALWPKKADELPYKQLIIDCNGAKGFETSANCTVLEAIKFYETSEFTSDEIGTALIDFYTSGASLSDDPDKMYQQYKEALDSIKLQERQFLKEQKAKIALEFLKFKTQQQLSCGFTVFFEGEKLSQCLFESVLKIPISRQLELWPDFLNTCVLPLLQESITRNFSQRLCGIESPYKSEAQLLVEKQSEHSFCAKLMNMKRKFELCDRELLSSSWHWLTENPFLSNLNVESILANPLLASQQPQDSNETVRATLDWVKEIADYADVLHFASEEEEDLLVI
jgi:hypothetical protein